jgi:hypothetical protein
MPKVVSPYAAFTRDWVRPFLKGEGWFRKGGAYLKDYGDGFYGAIITGCDPPVSGAGMCRFYWDYGLGTPAFTAWHRHLFPDYPCEPDGWQLLISVDVPCPEELALLPGCVHQLSPNYWPLFGDERDARAGALFQDYYAKTVSPTLESWLTPTTLAAALQIPLGGRRPGVVAVAAEAMALLPEGDSPRIRGLIAQVNHDNLRAWLTAQVDGGAAPGGA